MSISDILIYSAIGIVPSFVTHFLTKYQCQKDSLKTYREKACLHLWENLMDFVRESYPTNHTKNIFDAYGKLQSSFYKSESFLPTSISYKIRGLLGSIGEELRRKIPEFSDQMLREFNLLDKSQFSQESFFRKPNINILLLEVFSPLTNEIPAISEEIKKTFGLKPAKSYKKQPRID
jgi:hypothetical protein